MGTKVMNARAFRKPNDTSRLVIDAAMRVHTALGAGVLESACHACLAYEFTKAGFVEIKCVERVLPVHRAQLLSDLRLSGHKLGLLLNFNVPHLRQGIHRVMNGPEAEL